MRIALALFFAAALAGCGQRPANQQNVAGGSGLPTPGPRPAGSGDASASFDQGFRQSYRTSAIETCVGTADTRAAQGGGAPPGTNFRPYCTCFVDRSMAGLSVDQLASLRPGAREQTIAVQCAQENGLRPGGSGSK